MQPVVKRELTKSPEDRRCRWCGRRLAERPGPGRKREFCKDSCRQLDYQARRRSGEAGLGEDQIIVSRRELAELHDKLYALEAAIEDVEHDLAEAKTLADHRAATQHLMAAARPLTRALPFT